MQLRDFQVEALKAIRAKSHVICVAPTGSGKSLIYEKLATENRKKLLLVTPLVALARQQQRNLEDLRNSLRSK